MPAHTTPQPLALTGGEGEAPPSLRYRPLAAFACADYVAEYAGALESSGVFDRLKYGGVELGLDRDRLDISGLAAIGSAFASLLQATADGDPKRLRTVILDHYVKFKVEIHVDGDWLPLDSFDAIDAHLSFAHTLEALYALAGGVLRPLLSRLRSPDKGKRGESPKPSPSDTPAS